MILQALAEYYERKMEDEEDPLPPFGFERKEIPFLIVLDREGNFVDLEDTRDQDGKWPKGRRFVVPQGKKRSGQHAYKTAYLLWDNVGYVLGEDTRGRPEWSAKQHASFVCEVRALADSTGDDAVSAVLAFLTRGAFGVLREHPNWKELLSIPGANISFRIDGERQLVCQRAAVREVVGAQEGDEAQGAGMCLVQGGDGPIARLHQEIIGVAGTNKNRGNIVSFNEYAYQSYGLVQGANAPVGVQAEFAYRTGLNHLLRRGSPQRLHIGDMIVVFWAERQHPMETAITALFGEMPKDDPGRGAEAVRALYGAPWSGREPLREDDQTRFYVLGLAPNVSRIAIRLWHVSTAGEMAGHLRRHFDDLRIAHGPSTSDILPLKVLLRSTATLGKDENIRPNLAGAWMKSVLEGAPYPRELLSAAVQRNRAEQDVSYPRAALVKACLNRETRRTPHTSTPELTVSLDRSNPNPAYRLGRLFAVLERIQEAASPGLNATIRDRYYGAASTTPVTVFPRLLKLSGHHLGKLESPGLRVFYEKEIGEIMNGITDFPALLSLPDQGHFSIGYYHQRQDAFTKKSSEQGAAA